MIRKNAFALVVSMILALVMALPGVNPASYGARTVSKPGRAAAVESSSITALPVQGDVMATGVSGGGNSGG